MRVVLGRVLCCCLGAVVACHHAPAPSVGTPADGAGPAPQLTPGEGRWTSCGELECRQYESVEDAFADAIRGPKREGGRDGALPGPRVVSIGEAHAQKGARVASSASRFTSQLLPLLAPSPAAAPAGHASDLLIEILNPPPGCAKVTHDVRKKQEKVTAAQAPGDQSEYVTMGTRARALGIVPDLLRPTCADLDAIEAAGEDAIDASLRTIERLTQSQVVKLLERERGEDDIVVTYGGALHNALRPTPARAAWSFGPALDAYTKGRYVELDLYVPEFIDDTEAWRKLPFYAHYDRSKLGGKTTTFRDGKSVVLIFPASAM